MVLVLRTFATGPLGPYAAGFAQELVLQGYTVNGGEQHLRFIAHLNRWMLAAGVAVGDVDEAVIDQFLAERRLGICALPIGESDAATVGVSGAAGRFASREHVRAESGRGPARALQTVPDRRARLAERTARGYVDAVRPFVASHAGADRPDLAALAACDVTGFMLAACPHRAVPAHGLRLIEYCEDQTADHRHILVELNPLQLACGGIVQGPEGVSGRRGQQGFSHQVSPRVET